MLKTRCKTIDWLLIKVFTVSVAYLIDLLSLGSTKAHLHIGQRKVV